MPSLCLRCGEGESCGPGCVCVCLSLSPSFSRAYFPEMMCASIPKALALLALRRRRVMRSWLRARVREPHCRDEASGERDTRQSAQRERERDRESEREIEREREREREIQ